MVSEYYTNMTCGLKVDTQSPGWYKKLTKVLKKINGVKYRLDAEEGMAYISGRVDPNKILRKIAKAGKDAELCWVETGNQNQNLYGNEYDVQCPYWTAPTGSTYYWPKQYYHDPAAATAAALTHYYPQRQTYPYYHQLPYAYPSWA